MLGEPVIYLDTANRTLQHPLEIENCLLSHDSIMEASCVGLKDERYGEVVAAFVRRVDGHSLRIDEVQAWVRERLSNHLGMPNPSWCPHTHLTMVKCPNTYSGPKTSPRRQVGRYRNSSSKSWASPCGRRFQSFYRCGN
jgi:acyl-CoA synthetase (AMP-forming)/AMP-acid ligase II